MPWARSLLFVVFAFSCATDDAPSDAVCETSAVLVDMSQWVLSDSPTDPFPDRPPGMPCTDHGWGLDDGGAFGVYTGECDYVTVSQPLQAALSTCNELVFELTHDRLTAGDGVVAEGYVGLAIADRLVWEKKVPIPGPPLYEELRVAIDREIPAGTPVQFHIHNHGSNGWRLLSLERQVRSTDDAR